MKFTERARSFWDRNKEVLIGCAKGAIAGYALGNFFIDVTGIRDLSYDVREAKGYSEGFLEGQRNAAGLIAEANGCVNVTNSTTV